MPASLSNKNGTLVSPSAGTFVTCTSTYTTTQADLDSGSVTNVASAHGFFGTDAVIRPHGTTAVQTNPPQTLTIQKSASPATYSSVGATISYSYKVINTGNVTLSGPFKIGRASCRERV